jgi:hypothetical protein
MTRKQWLEALTAEGFSTNTMDHPAKHMRQYAVYGPDRALLTSCIAITTDEGTRGEGVIVYWCSEGPKIGDDIAYLKSLPRYAPVSA